jgi:hypothetical protein
METLPGDWLSLLILTFVLGMKHGFDADHLATIDGLTRYNARTRPGMARYCGTFFSLGHGAVVMAIALGVSALAGRWEVPEWFGTLGAVISIAFLVALGSLNLAAVLRAEPDQIVQPVGLKGRLLGNLRHVSHPGLVALVGAQHGGQVQAAQGDKEGNRNDGAQRAEPFGHLPTASQRRNAKGNAHHHGAMAERKQGAAIARQARPGAGVIAGQTVDGRQMVGIEAVLHAEHESKDQQRQPVARQRFHGHPV